MDRRSCGVISHAVQATRAAADLERFASFRRGPPAAGSPRLAGPSSQASWFEAWNLAVSSLELVKFQAGTCQVGALGLSGGGLELVKFEPGSCQIEALSLTTLSC